MPAVVKFCVGDVQNDAWPVVSTLHENAVFGR